MMWQHLGEQFSGIRRWLTADDEASLPMDDLSSTESRHTPIEQRKVNSVVNGSAGDFCDPPRKRTAEGGTCAAENRHPLLPALTKCVMSARFLEEAYERLMRPVLAGHPFQEEFYFVGGYRVGETFVWDHLAGVAYEQQSAGGVVVETSSCTSVLTAIRDAGQYLVGHIHSHPGAGPGANRPSATDERFVERLACGRSVALGAIFSRGTCRDSAFVRFFASTQLPFDVTVVGSNFKRLNDHEHNYMLSLQQKSLAQEDVSFPPLGTDV